MKKFLSALFVISVTLCTSSSFGAATDIRSCDKESDLATITAEKLSAEFVGTFVELQEQHDRNVTSVDKHTAEMVAEFPEAKEELIAMGELMKKPPQLIPIEKYERLSVLSWDHAKALTEIIRCINDLYEDLKRDVLRLQ